MYQIYSPIAEWEKARETREKAEEMLKASPDRYALSWQGMGIKANRRWQRRDAKIEKILKVAEKVVWADQCKGCGEYSEGGHVHNSAYCRIDARYDG